MAEISFHSQQLIVDDLVADFAAISFIFEETHDTYQDADSFYKIEKEIIEDRYLWLYSSYGKAYPRTDKVIEMTTHMEEDNPRKITQIEPDKQLFSIYDTIEKVLYISNRKKIGFYKLYLRSFIDEDIVIKNFYIDVDDFAEKVKTISSVNLITKNNLFSANSGLFQEEKNVFGLGEPTDFHLEALFENAKITDAFIRKIKEFNLLKGQGEVETLICIGRDDKNIETVFNMDTFVDKLIVKANKDVQGLYDVVDIQHLILNKVKKV